ncbi:MAG: hypothetical protein ABIF09_00370 [Gemmatimonadota bacterium]
MPEIDEKVMTFVEVTLKKNPKIQLEDLFERTKKVLPSIGKLSKRQFNARYPLQVKRRRALVARSRGAGRKRASPVQVRTPRKPQPQLRSLEPREVVRQAFLQFATDIAAAEERKDLVKVLAGVDQYVDQVLEGVAKD